jgi:hypothetical protein
MLCKISLLSILQEYTSLRLPYPLMRQLLVPVLLLVSLRGSSQSRSLRDPANWQAQRDSMEQLFYQQPPYVRVSYYRNAQQRPWSKAMTIQVLVQHHWISLQPVTGSTFLLPPLQGDSLQLSVRAARQPRIVYTLRKRDVAHGAAVTFGFIKRKFLTEKERSEAAWEPMGEVLQPLDLTAWRQTKGIRGLRYLRIIPRVYGDGAVFTTTAPVFRRGYIASP